MSIIGDRVGVRDAAWSPGVARHEASRYCGELEGAVGRPSADHEASPLEESHAEEDKASVHEAPTSKHGQPAMTWTSTGSLTPPDPCGQHPLSADQVGHCHEGAASRLQKEISRIVKFITSLALVLARSESAITDYRHLLAPLNYDS